MKETGWKKIFHANGNQKKSGIARLISNKTDFRRVYYNEQGRKLHDDQGINIKRINLN